MALKKVKGSELYKQGRFNIARVSPNPDGSTTYSCDGDRAPRPYSFRARGFLTEREEVLEDELVELEASAHPEPVEGARDVDL